MPEVPRSTSGAPGCGSSPRLTCTRATASPPTGTARRAGSNTAVRGSRGAAPGAADAVAHPPILLTTSESAPKSRRSAQSRGVGRKATQLRRIRSATSRREISGLCGHCNGKGYLEEWLPFDAILTFRPVTFMGYRLAGIPSSSQMYSPIECVSADGPTVTASNTYLHTIAPHSHLIDGYH